MSAKADEGKRRETLIKLASAAVFLTIVAVAVLIVVSQSGSSGGDANNVQGRADVEQLLDGIPQQGLVLGQPSAKVELREFADLQCPFCKGYAEDQLPQVIENQVRTGKVKLDYRTFTIIGPESIPAAAAATAAGKQGRGWYYVEIFYRNQGEEDSGYVTEEFLTAIAKAAGVPDIAQWSKDRKSKAVLREVEEATAEAERLGFEGTPSFAIEGPGTNGIEALGHLESAEAIESAISAAR